jgi:hypothetical protein
VLNKIDQPVLTSEPLNISRPKVEITRDHNSLPPRRIKERLELLQKFGNRIRATLDVVAPAVSGYPIETYQSPPDFAVLD